mgnify:CR=1 FL=1
MQELCKIPSLCSHSTLNSADQKYDLFLQSVKKVEFENSVWLAVTNRGDIESGMTENCWHHLHALNITNYLFMAVDEWSFNFLTCKGINSHWDPFVSKEIFQPVLSGLATIQKHRTRNLCLQGWIW